MKIIAESNKYQVIFEYERVFLIDKKTSRETYIGDFYGDLQVAFIAESENYCVMGGAGIIIYYFTEPFEEYTYHTLSKQWKEWGRKDPKNIVWIKNITSIDDGHVEVETENMQKYIVGIYGDVVDEIRVADDEP